MRLRGPITAALLVLVGVGRPCDAETFLSDPLDGSTTGAQDGGSFAWGGWQAPHQIVWDLGVALTEGTFSVEVTNWDPNSDSAQHLYPKQQIINMYEASNGSPHDSDASNPKTGFFNVRTGSGYDNCFKFLSSPAGFTERIETRVKKPYGTISPNETHTISVTWTSGGTITVFLDGAAQVTHEHGKQFALRYVFIGTDNAPAGTYGPQQDVVYKNVLVTGPGGGPDPDPDPDPPPGDPLVLSPTHDTWADPGAPAQTHGSSDELRVGGDGRTIFARFDVAGVGPIAKATLRLKALNAGGGGNVHAVADESWTEAGLTFDNMPAIDPIVLASPGKVAIGSTYDLDVSAAVQCDGPHSFAINSADQDGAGYWSKESAQGGPQLILVPDPGGDGCSAPPPPPPEPGPEPPPPPDPGPEPAPPADAGPGPGPPPDAGPAGAPEGPAEPPPPVGWTDAGGRGLPLPGGGEDATTPVELAVPPPDGGCSTGRSGAPAPLPLQLALLLGAVALLKRYRRSLPEVP